MRLASEGSIFIPTELKSAVANIPSSVNGVNVLGDDKNKNILVKNSSYTVWRISGDFDPVIIIRMVDGFSAFSF